MTKAATLPGVLFSAAVASSCFAATPASPEAPVPSSLRITPGGYEVIQKRSSAQTYKPPKTEVRVFENILTFANSRVSIPLSRSASYHHVEGRVYRTGYDAKSLRLSWLEEGSLLHVSWRTVPVGRGRYAYQGDVKISLTGETGTEVYREFFLRSSSLGWSSAGWTTCDIQYDSAKREVQVILEETNSATYALDADEDAPHSLSIRAGDWEGKQYRKCKVRMREAKHYLLQANSLSYQRTDASLEILVGQGRVSDIAECLLRREYVTRSIEQRYGPVSAEEVKSTVEDLLRMNPHLNETDQCRGPVAFPRSEWAIISTGSYDGAFGYAL